MFSKGQMEIFGLVIIVVLLAIGLLFAVIILTKSPTLEVQRVKYSVVAYNFLNTMMGTTSIGCGQRSVRNLLQDCALSPDWNVAFKCENGLNTCQLTEEMIRDMLEATLGKWGKNYHFYINGTEAVEKIRIEHGECKGEREGASRPEKIRTGLDVTLTLHICQ